MYKYIDDGCSMVFQGFMPRQDVHRVAQYFARQRLESLRILVEKKSAQRDIWGCDPTLEIA